MLLHTPINSSEHRICQVDTNICRKQKQNIILKNYFEIFLNRLFIHNFVYVNIISGLATCHHCYDKSVGYKMTKI